VESDGWLATMVDSPTHGEQALLKKQCLERDNYRCLVTGMWDREARNKIKTLQSRELFAPTELAHIIPFCLGHYSTKEEVIYTFYQQKAISKMLINTQEQELSRKWATLNAFFPDLRDIARLAPDEINQPRNAMTMVPPMHAAFGNFEFALQSTVRIQ
jgi:hypothetical protein